jgi:hypothetical protein
VLKSIDMVDGLKITEICLFSTVCDVNDTRNQGQSRYQVTYSEAENSVVIPVFELEIEVF